MPVTAEKITSLCDQWLEKVMKADGAMAIGVASEGLRLRLNGVVFHEIDYDALRAAIVGLTQVVLLPGLNTVVDADHSLLWAWCGEILLSPHAAIFAPEQRELQHLFETAVHCALSGASNPSLNVRDWQRENLIRDIQRPHARQLVKFSSLTLVYLAFPLLEGLLKLRCAQYVDMNGEVLADFEVPKRRVEAGQSKQYGPDRRSKQCSSIRDLLLLYHGAVASAAIAEDLRKLFKRLAVLENKDGPDVLADWRNASLHGSRSYTTIAGAVIGCALLVAIDGMEARYSEVRHATVNAIVERQRFPGEPDGEFYPPW
jgi:hypothetical protein